MSFKREGDDKSQLNILKKRRVADLLSHFIPEDEAALMKNGRYTCLVCSYRPLFDTVDMLSVHRKGKRHLEGLKAFYGKKTRLKNEITKRRHENYVLTEERGEESSSSAPLLEQTRKITHHALLKTAPYDSCHRRTSTKSVKGLGSDPTVDAPSKSAPDPEACQSTDAANISSESKSCSVAAEDINGSQASVGQEAEPLTAQKRREMEHYLKLKSQGWLRDRGGQWLKDESVEFDSDEEEPPSLPPLPSSQGKD